MKRLLKYAVWVAVLPVLWAQAPQIPVTGTLGAGGVFPLVNSPSIVFATDANHTMTYPEMSGSSGFILVTSSTALSATRNLVAPLVKGFTWAIENSTAGSHSIQVIGATGTGVTIANGYTLTVYCDGTNYVTLPSASGGTVLGVTGTAPVVSSGGTNPVISMAQATSSVPGYLAAADWSTFNGKQSALGYTPAHSGANSDITSMSGLTTPWTTTQGGTGGSGGTGYAYGNGSASFSYSPTIPCASITGAICGAGSTGQVVFTPATLITGMTTSGTFYISPYGLSTNTITTNNNFLIPLTGTAANLYVGTEVAINAGAVIVVTLQDNRTNTLLTCTISATSQCSDTVHSASLTQGDTVQFKIVNTNDISIGQWLTIGFSFTPTPLT